MILVDSSVWIDYFNGTDTAETRRLDLLLGNELIAIGDLILTEVLQGFRRDTDFETAKTLMLSLTVVELLGETRALESAANYRKLRKIGITVRKTADVIIATYCIAKGIPLLFTDKDFLPFVEHLQLQAA